MTNVAQHHFLNAEISKRIEEQREAQIRGAQLQHEITMLQEIRDNLKIPICSSCKGHGYQRVFRAQDDSYTEKCTRCQGTGLAP